MKDQQKKATPHRFRRPRPDSKYNKDLLLTYELLLGRAERTMNQTDLLETAVRSEISTGLAYLVRAAYDCKAATMHLDMAASFAFIETSTAEWFRWRGFAEWFCQAAAAGFNTSRPRTLREMQATIVYKKHPAAKKK